MKLQYVRAFIVLVAGLITIIINIKTQKEVTTSLLILLIVLLIFYFIGTLVTELIEKSLQQSSKNPNLEIINGDEKEEETQTEEVHVSFDEEETE